MGQENTFGDDFGDDLALDRTLAELAPRLLRYCRGRSGDAGLAEEAAQDALTSLVQRWRAHGPPDEPAAFAFVVARRRLARRQRQHQRLAPLELVAEHPAGPRTDPEARAVRNGALRAAHGALAQLGEAEREALLLVAVGELDTASAAAVLGIGRSALKMRIHRARQRMQRHLENEHAPG